MWLIFMPHAVNFDVLDITQPIHYWSVVTPSLNKWLLLFIFLLSTCLGLILVWFIWKRYLGYLLVIIFLSCISSTALTVFTDMNLWMDTNSIEHIQTISFGGKEYRLALAHLWDEDHEYADYKILECDLGGEICQPIKLPARLSCFYMDEDIQWASLNTNQDTLYLNCGGYETQILPAIN